MSDSRLLRVLRKCEFVSTDTGDPPIWHECPACQHLRRDGHATDCELQAEINAEEMRLEYLRSKAEPC